MTEFADEAKRKLLGLAPSLATDDPIEAELELLTRIQMLQQLQAQRKAEEREGQ